MSEYRPQEVLTHGHVDALAMAERLRVELALEREQREALEARLAQVQESAAPFLELARERLLRRSYEPIPMAACERFLLALGQKP